MTSPPTPFSASRTPVLEYTILALLGAAAIVMLWAEPPFIGADELFHYQRALQVAQGNWLSPQLGPNSWGGPIDSRAFEFLIAFLKKYTGQAPLTWDQAQTLADTFSTRDSGWVSVPFPSTAAFSPLAYLPQAAGIAAAAWAGFDLMAQTYAGRLANLVCYLGLLGLIVHLLPCGRRGVLLATTLPGMLHVAGTLSADPLNVTLPLLLATLVLRLRTNSIRARLALATIAALCLALALLKPILVIVTPIVLLVPRTAFRTPTRAWVFRLACIAAAALIAALWSAAYPFVPGEYWKTGADPAAMLARFVTHPIDALGFLVRSLQAWSWLWWQDADSRFGGHAPPYLIISGPAWADAAMLAAIVLAIPANPSPRPDKPAAAALAILAIAYALLVIAAFTIGFTPPDGDTVQGVQGRYFLLPFALAALATAALALRIPSRLSLGATLLAATLSLGLLVEAIPHLYAMRG